MATIYKKITHEYPLGIANAEDRRRIFLLVKHNSSSFDDMMKVMKEKTSQVIEKISAQKDVIWDGMKDDFSNAASASNQLGGVLGAIAGAKIAPVSAPKEKWLEQKTPSGNTIYGVCLPFPNSFVDTQTQKWEESGNVFSEAIGNKIGDQEFFGISANKALGTLANAVNMRRPIINPGYYQNYSGPQTRDFSFSWEFIPQSREEYEQVQMILYNLRMYTLPRSSGGQVYFAPHTFEIYIENPFIGSITRTEDVVCDKFDITWASDQQQYLDGTPKTVKLDMSFKENKVLTANDFG